MFIKSELDTDCFIKYPLRFNEKVVAYFCFNICKLVETINYVSLLWVILLCSYSNSCSIVLMFI